ncbi:MAG: hypothetical protein IMF11_13385 [Proteobacteria bacterium]|nr:hypothetical protein [Pseudomonadota bacterium]
MADKLGIFVTTNQHWDHLLNICKAAVAKEKELIIFFSHVAPSLCLRDNFSELAKVVEGHGKMSLCIVSMKEIYRLADENTSVPGIDKRDFGTQARHGDMLDELKETDRYLVL